jgi:dipeptidyl aminopeptidase/acylaminoacyl peptidase
MAGRPPEQPASITSYLEAFMLRSRRAHAPAVLWILLLAAAPLRAQQTSFTMQDVLDVASASVADMSEDGRWAVITTATLRDRVGVDNYRYGDPTYVAPGVADVALVNLRTGERRALFPEKTQVRGVRFSPDGNQIALLVREGDWFRMTLFDVARGRMRNVTLPTGQILSEGATPQWTADGTKLLVPLRTVEWLTQASSRFEQEVKGPIVVRSSADPFLSWDEIRRFSGRQVLALYDVASGRFQEVLPESQIGGGFAVSADGAYLRWNPDITKGTNYEQIQGSETQLKVKTLATGEERTLFENTRGVTVQWSGDGLSYAYARDGNLFVARTSGGEPRKLAGVERPRGDSTAAGGAPGGATTPADSAKRAAEARERFSPVRLSHDGKVLIASNSEGLWFFDSETGARERFQETQPDSVLDAPRWAVIAWSRDANSVYLSYESRTAWDRGVYRYDRASRQKQELVRGDDYYTGLNISADGSTILYTYAEGNRPSDIYVAGADLRNGRRITDANPQLRSRTFGKTELIQYLDADGKKSFGVLNYPDNYQAGTKYPTVFLIYETFFDDRFNSTIALLNANGYAVIQPSVSFEIGYPSEAWLKGVTAAANKLIEMGIADPDKLGVQGTSYGGYATNLLITQTNRFKAAINVSGKTDMISFYTDSPRLGTRNIHAPERSQDRLGATLWEQPQKYIESSAVMYADRIKTPLLLMTGQQDPNVPERTTSEMFYALRRLGRTVEWVSYTDSGHGMPTVTTDQIIDYHQRILAWYNKYLKGQEAKAAADMDGGR